MESTILKTKIIQIIKKLIKRILRSFGYVLEHYDHYNAKLDNHVILQDKLYIDIYNNCKKHTMISIELMYALYEATKYIVKNNIEDDFVEFGVWCRGSSINTFVL